GAVDGGHAARDRQRRADRARGFGLRAGRRAAGIADHGDAAQRREPDHRLHVARKRAGAGRDRRQGHAAGGRDQRRLLHPHRLHRHRHLPVPHPRAFRHRGCGRDGPVPGGTPMMGFAFERMEAVLLIPLGAAALLAFLPGYRLSARLNVAAAFLTLLASLSLLFGDRSAPGRYLLVDDLNIVFIVLTTFVGFTTSVFSASYIGHEIETKRLTPVYLRFYHAMYQVLMFAMNLALLANNIGLMWVAVE